MRIISGTCKGRKLTQLKGLGIRPTSDRVRESIFNIIGQRVSGAIVLDLFAGTGAFGTESLSRGANMAFFVDIAKNSCDVIRKNIELCGFISQSAILQFDASKPNIPAEIRAVKFNLVFIDPPYEKGFIEKVLRNTNLINCLFLDYKSEDSNSNDYDDLYSKGHDTTSIIILEHSIKEKIPDNLEMLDIYDQRQYGKTLISFLRRC